MRLITIHTSSRPIRVPLLIGAIVTAFLLTGCASIGPDLAQEETASWQEEPCFPVEQLNDDDRALADSLMQDAVNYQALYTLVGDLKPMSTLVQKRFTLARPDSVVAGVRDAMKGEAAQAAYNDADQLHRVADALSCGAVQTVVVPFNATREGNRTVQTLLVDQHTFERTLEDDAPFWGQWAFTPNADPATIITTVEHEASLDRFRGYGYLFGYPEHAVTFFVEAARTGEDEDIFVERDFFHIPTAKAETNRFTYAVPKGYVPAEPDSAIHRRAMEILTVYRERRAHHIEQNDTLQPVELLREWYREEPELDPRRPGTQ